MMTTSSSSTSSSVSRSTFERGLYSCCPIVDGNFQGMYVRPENSWDPKSYN
jgi:hypothetical protein